MVTHSEFLVCNPSLKLTKKKKKEEGVGVKYVLIHTGCVGKVLNCFSSIYILYKCNE